MAGPPDPEEVLALTVLPYMRQPLMTWLEQSCSQYVISGAWEILAQMLKIDYTNRQPYVAIVNALNQDNDLLLDAIDARLRLHGAGPYHDHLTRVLRLAGSGWQLNHSRDGLEQAVDETVREVAQAAMRSEEGSAARHLRNAWNATYGRERNPTHAHAHAEMVRAVESAARPAITPNDLRATLGTLIGQLDAQRSLYVSSGASATNDGVPSIVAMMQVLWQQQTDRHGANPTIPATQERVEFLLPIAAALVHAFLIGAIRRRAWPSRHCSLVKRAPSRNHHVGRHGEPGPTSPGNKARPPPTATSASAADSALPRPQPRAADRKRRAADLTGRESVEP